MLLDFTAAGVCAFLLLSAPQARSQAAALPPTSASHWAADAAHNEIKIINYGHFYLRYREHTRDSKGDHVRDMVESREGPVARLILKDGRPLTPEEDQAEHDRLQAMLDSPAAFAKHVKNDASGKKMASDLIKLMPEAMEFSYAPGQPQRAERQAGPDDPPEIVLDYKPNPEWTPPNTTSEALTGLEGRVWIDPQARILTRMEGTVFRGVNFGLFLAHIYPGGKLTFEQTKVSNQRAIFTHFTEHLNIRVLVKALKEDSEIEASQFTPVPEMSYQDAVKLLLATPLPTH